MTDSLQLQEIIILYILQTHIIMLVNNKSCSNSSISNFPILSNTSLELVRVENKLYTEENKSLLPKSKCNNVLSLIRSYSESNNLIITAKKHSTRQLFVNTRSLLSYGCALPIRRAEFFGSITLIDGLCTFLCE